MDLTKVSTKLMDFLKKYRYPILVLLIGILLMAIPQRKEVQQQEPTECVESVEQKKDLAKELEEILGQIKGVGRVKVVLSLAAGESYIYQHDQDVSASDTGSATKEDTVIITDSDRNQSPILSQVLPPRYLGAIIVCQGAEEATVKLAVVEAVSRLTGLGADAISVLKMK